jgi:phosphohistidine phosphatase
LKTIIIIRHAKSSWAQVGQADIERPLNDRGLADAPEMGKRLALRNLPIQAILSSNATRAMQTAQAIAEPLGLSNGISYNNILYHASPFIINDVISHLPQAIHTLAIVCHNPGITEWVNEQASFVIHNMPTCAMAAFNANANTWQNFATSTKHLLFIDYPKLIS